MRLTGRIIAGKVIPSQNVKKSIQKRRKYSTQITEEVYQQSKSHFDFLTQDMPIKVNYIPGKGRGLVAKKSFSPGELIIAETPFITAPSDCWASSSYCWTCFVPLYEPKLLGDDQITQKMLENGSLHPDTEEMRIQMNHVYSTLKIPLVQQESILVASEANNVKFCSTGCKDEAKKRLLPLLLAILADAGPIKKSKALSPAGRKTFSILSRILARASIDPNLVLATMSTYVVSQYLNGEAEMQLSDSFSLLQELFPEHKPWFSPQVFARFVSAVNLNSFEYNIFPSSLGISTDANDDSNWRFRVAPEISKEKTITATSLCAVSSMINHSCEPNVIARLPFSRTMNWVAAREIPEGEELVASYIGETDASTEERKKILLEAYEFECTCPRCKGSV